MQCMAKPLQYCKVIGLQLIKINEKKKKKNPTCNAEDLQETQVWSLGCEDPLEKEMATHSSIPGWKIPWTEESGRL